MRELKVVASKVGNLHLEKTKMPESAKEKLKKAQESQGCARGIQQPEHIANTRPEEP
jgi:hypothetical protein